MKKPGDKPGFLFHSKNSFLIPEMIFRYIVKFNH